MTSIHRASLITHINDINVECKLNMQKPDDIYPPEQVTGLTANAPDEIPRIDLSWDANPEPDVAHYNIYRDNVKIAESFGTTFSDNTIEQTEYDYSVSAVDRSGNEGPQSAVVHIAPDDIPELAPPKVTGVVATTVSHEEIRVNWTASSSSHDHYNIYRDGLKVAEVGIAETSYLDTGLEPETTYSYTVCVVDTQGDVSDPSDPDSATTQAEPVDTSYDGTGKPSDDEIDEYETGLNNAMSNIVSYWTGWWPLLHYEFEVELVPEDVPAGHPAEPMEGKAIHIHQAKNLLGQTEIEEVTPLGDGSFGLFTPEFQEFIFLNIAVTAFLLAIKISASLFEICANTGNVPGMILSLAAMIIAVVCLQVLIDHTIDTFIERGDWTHWDACIFYAYLGVMAFSMAFGLDIYKMIRNAIFGVSPVSMLEETLEDNMYGSASVFNYSKFAQLVIFAMSLCFFTFAFAHLTLSF